MNLHPAHVPSQLAKSTIRPTIELELKHEEITHVVGRQDVDKTNICRIFSAIPAVGVEVHLQLSASDRKARDVLDYEVAKLTLHRKRREIHIGRYRHVVEVLLSVDNVFVWHFTTKQRLVLTLQ